MVTARCANVSGQDHVNGAYAKPMFTASAQLETYKLEANNEVDVTNGAARAQTFGMNG